MYDFRESSPIENINLPELAGKEVTLFFKREDLVYGSAHGNKFRKLKYQIQQAIQKDCKALVTLGGAFSNHIYATAYAGSKFNIPTIGYIRGEYDPENPTLKQAREWGMELIFISRRKYKFMYSREGIQALQQSHQKAYVIPLGGTHSLAIQGMAELVYEVNKQTDQYFDHWVCPLATGGTAAGLVKGLAGKSKVIGFNVLKGQKLPSLQSTLPGLNDADALIFEDAHFGGIGKFPQDLIQFIHQFYKTTGIFLDPVYTGKMMFRLVELILENYFAKNSSILVVHTGGLQGIKAFNFRFKTKLPAPDIP